jgi:DNA processing protein
LIRQGAKLVETAQDISEELAPELSSSATSLAQNSFFADPVAAPHPVLEALGYDPLHVDTLQRRTGLDAATLQAQLLSLELAGHLARLDDGRFQRLN